MGTYTELVIKCSIKKDAPIIVIDVLNKLFNGSQKPISELPDHDFFKCQRWDLIGTMSSFYHTPFALSKFSDGYLFSRSDLKNYGDEIEKFIDWLMPYINEDFGCCIGWKWREEDTKPILLFKE